jgi:T5SS/PEP-CTERM-associated repeat protein
MRQLALALLVGGIASSAFAQPAFKGMSYTSFNPTVLSGAGSDQSLFNISLLGTDTVALNFWWYQDSVNSTSMYSDTNRTATAASIEHAIDQIHSLGMKVFLKPMLDVQDGTWRANIAPNDVDQWFANYTDFVGTFADMAQAKGVELFSIGCEFNLLENPTNTQRWIDVVDDVRSRYDGEVTYAANWNEGGIGGGYELLPWWDQLDYIGIDAYFPHSDVANPSLTQMQSSWNQVADVIEAWRVNRELTDKQVIFTEVGLGSWNGSNVTPWETPPQGSTSDEQEQADGYEALLSVMTQRDWWEGAFWWNWETNPIPGSTTGFTPQNKLVQDVLAGYYGGVVPPLPASNWNNDAGGSIGTGGNWTNGVPNSSFVAVFDRGEAADYTVQLNTTNRTIDQLRVGSNSVTFQSTTGQIRNLTADNWHVDEPNRGMIIGMDSGDVAVVTLTSTVGTFATRAATLGDAAGSNGTLNLTSSSNVLSINGSKPITAELLVGREGAGMLNVTGGARVSFTTIGANADFGLQTGSSGTVNISGTGSSWSSNGAVRVGVEGEALLTVADGGSFSSLLTIVGPEGEVRGNGTITSTSFQNNGLVSPGTSPGTLHITGAYTQSAEAKLLIEIASTTAFDRLEIIGTATLGGLLEVALLNGFVPELGDSFAIMSATGLLNLQLADSMLAPLPTGLGWELNHVGNALFLDVVAAGLPGDYNGDGTVNAADYTVWRDTLGQIGAGLAADGTGPAGTSDGIVDQLDYDLWKSRFGETAGSSSLGRALTSVPEPSSFLLFICFAMGQLLLDRRSFRDA